MHYLLDSTVLIDALRGRPAGERLRALQRDGDVPFICAVNVDEVIRGVLSHERPTTTAFLNGFRLAPLGYREGERSGEWRRHFAQRGVTLSQADCLIAAAAVGVEAKLATGNPDHFPMEGLTVEEWEIGR